MGVQFLTGMLKPCQPICYQCTFHSFRSSLQG